MRVWWETWTFLVALWYAFYAPTHAKRLLEVDDVFLLLDRSGVLYVFDVGDRRVWDTINCSGITSIRRQIAQYAVSDGGVRVEMQFSGSEAEGSTGKEQEYKYMG